MDTKLAIITIADNLLRSRGYHAFSFADISREMGIKTASIHYHFPSKTDLGIALVQHHRKRLSDLMAQSAQQPALRQLQAFLSIYESQQAEQLCVVGALMSDINSIDAPVKHELKKLTNSIHAWLCSILQQGQSEGSFNIHLPITEHASLIAATALASLQWSRLYGAEEACRLRQAAITPLIK